MDISRLMRQLASTNKKDRERVSIYVSKSVWLKYKKVTATAGPSVLIEQFMEEVIRQAEGGK